MTLDVSIGEGIDGCFPGRRRPRVLSLCCLYPNPMQPSQGIFVQRRLRGLAAFTDVRIVSPFAVAQYGNRNGKRLRLGYDDCPAQWRDGNISVMYPRWVYPPFSGSLIPFWLAAQMLFPLKDVQREFPFEIIDTHFGFPDGITGSLLSSALSVPFTMTLRGNEPKHSRSRLGRLLMSQALRKARRVFAVSERLREFAISLGAREDVVRTIPNGVDGDIFFPRDQAACRIKHGLPLQTPLILSAGALVERKGHHRIIEVLKNIGSAELVIAGGPGPEGQYERQLRDCVARLGLERRVRFLGAAGAEELAEYMSAVDVFCLASTNEGWPNVVHEALACGTPVVATDVGAVPEMLAGGRRGMMVPVGDAQRLQHALEEALRIQWSRPEISAWARSRGWNDVAAEIYEEINLALTESRG